jgi:hypothetical protein
LRYEGFVVPPAELDEPGVNEQVALFDVPDAKASSTRTSGARLLYVVTGLAVAFGIVASVMTAAYVRLRNDESTSDKDRTEVSTVAAQVAEAITSVDAQGPVESQSERIRALGTAPLIEQYEGILPSIQQTLTKVNVTSIHGQISKVYVGDIADDQAEAVVVVDLVFVGPKPRVDPDQYLRIHLARIDGQWKVDNVESVLAKIAAQTGASSSPSTSTESSSG